VETILTVIDSLNIYQPKSGYRFSLEPFILSKDIDIKDNQCVVDFGSGCGIISVLIGKINPRCKIYAVENNDDMSNIIRKNIALHNLDNVIVVKTLEEIKTNEVDIVISNPPYFTKDSYRSSKKFFSEKFETQSIKEILLSIRRIIKNKGLLRLSYHPTRIIDLIKILDGLGFGIKSIKPIYGSMNSKASFVILDSKFNTKSYTIIEKAVYLD